VAGSVGLQPSWPQADGCHRTRSRHRAWGGLRFCASPKPPCRVCTCRFSSGVVACCAHINHFGCAIPPQGQTLAAACGHPGGRWHRRPPAQPPHYHRDRRPLGFRSATHFTCTARYHTRPVAARSASHEARPQRISARDPHETGCRTGGSAILIWFVLT